MARVKFETTRKGFYPGCDTVSRSAPKFAMKMLFRPLVSFPLHQNHSSVRKKLFVMFWLFTIFLTIVIANPILQDPDELTVLDDSSTNSPNLVFIENSPQVKCLSNALTDDNFSSNTGDDNAAIYRRAGYCPADDVPIPKGQTTNPGGIPADNPYGKASNDSPCLKENPVLVTCGGPESLGLREPHNIEWSPYVANCIVGKFFMFFI